MKLNTLRRHFRESFKSLGRNGWMTFASISAVTVTLLLVGVFLVIMLNIQHITKQIERDVEIRVHVDLSATDADKDALRAKLEAFAGVEKVTYSSKDEELQKLIESFGEDGQSFRLFEQDNPLSDVFIVKAENPLDTEKIAKQIETLPSVSKVKYGKGQIEKLFAATTTIRNVGLALIVGLLFTAMFLISNTIKITIFARRREIEIMRLVGATNGFIRWPFFLEGLWLGVLGSIVPIAIVLSAYSYTFDLLYPRLKDTFFQLLPFYPFAWQVAAVLVLLGACIGIWGSLMSVRRFLKV